MIKSKRTRIAYLMIIILAIGIIYTFIDNSYDSDAPLNIFKDQEKLYEFNSSKWSGLYKVFRNNEENLIEIGKLDATSNCLDDYIGAKYYSVRGKSDAFRVVLRDSKYEIFIFSGISDKTNISSFKVISDIYGEEENISSIKIYSIDEDGNQGRIIHKISSEIEIQELLKIITDAKLISENVNPYNDMIMDEDNRINIQIHFENKNILTFTYYQNLNYIYFLSMVFQSENGQQIQVYRTD